MRTDIKFCKDCQGKDCILTVEYASSVPDKKEVVFIANNKYLVADRSFEYIDGYNCVVWILVKRVK